MDVDSEIDVSETESEPIAIPPRVESDKESEGSIHTVSGDEDIIERDDRAGPDMHRSAPMGKERTSMPQPGLFESAPASPENAAPTAPTSESLEADRMTSCIIEANNSATAGTPLKDKSLQRAIGRGIRVMDSFTFDSTRNTYIKTPA